MQHTISVLMVNRFGVLSRISGLFSGRGFNIESLNVAETNDPNISRMTIVTRGDDKKVEQITKQLNKLVDIIKVVDITEEKFVDRSSCLPTLPSFFIAFFRYDPFLHHVVVNALGLLFPKPVEQSADHG